MTTEQQAVIEEAEQMLKVSFPQDDLQKLQFKSFKKLLALAKDLAEENLLLRKKLRNRPRPRLTEYEKEKTVRDFINKHKGR